MPPITVFNLRTEDSLSEIEAALRGSIRGRPELEIDDDEVDFVPVQTPDGFRPTVTRINVDIWEGPARTKEALQGLAEEMAKAFQSVVGQDRRVKVVIRPYDVGTSGWVSL